MQTDGTGLRQVSFPPADEAEKVARWSPGWHTDDIHPCYLPDGKIIFSSTRCEHTVLCGGSSHLVAPGLHRMDADGSNVEQLTRSPVSEFCPVVLDDGRVMYHRWEYIDKGARVAKTIWSMNPDGTRPEELYGVADDATTVYMYPQAIPGSDHRLVCVGTCHFPQGGCLGAIMLIDFRNGVRVTWTGPGRSGLRSARSSVFRHQYHAPRVRGTSDGTGLAFSNSRTVDMYTIRTASKVTCIHTLIPVSDHEFLVSYKVNPADHYKEVPNAYALYLIDTEGRHRFVHRDEKLSCWHPIPLVAAERTAARASCARSCLCGQ